MMKPVRFAYFKRRMEQRAGIAISTACLVPSPFPFTVVIASASAFAYPRRRLLGFIALCAAGSAYQVMQWVRHSRSVPSRAG